MLYGSELECQQPDEFSNEFAIHYDVLMLPNSHVLKLYADCLIRPYRSSFQNEPAQAEAPLAAAELASDGDDADVAPPLPDALIVSDGAHLPSRSGPCARSFIR